MTCTVTCNECRGHMKRWGKSSRLPIPLQTSNHQKISLLKGLLSKSHVVILTSELHLISRKRDLIYLLTLTQSLLYLFSLKLTSSFDHLLSPELPGRQSSRLRLRWKSNRDWVRDSIYHSKMYQYIKLVNRQKAWFLLQTNKYELSVYVALCHHKKLDKVSSDIL